MKIKTVSVIGANGVMGCNVSAIFASFGAARVYMVSREKEKSVKAVDRAAKSVRADSIICNLIPADYTELEKCVSESDLVFESVAENFDIKAEITARVGVAARTDTILCSGTSGLSITRLAGLLPPEKRKNYMGVHMFNPPYTLNLCELIKTEYTDPEIYDSVKQYLKSTLLRTIVEVKDTPAFLGNRIGFHFINKALIYAERYKDSGGIDYIDAILGGFTGRSMAPLVTSDFVGLEVHKAIVDNISRNTADYAADCFVMPEFACRLVAENRLGRKTNGGLYKKRLLDNGAKLTMVYDLTTGGYRETMKYIFPFKEAMLRHLRIGDYGLALRALIDNQSVEAKICLEFLLEYIIYSLYCASEVGTSIHAADDVMATGFNWCPPLAMAEAFESVADFRVLCRERLDPQIIKNVDIDGLFSKIVKSGYDYRRYFKSAR